MRVFRSTKWLLVAALGIVGSVGAGVALATVTSTVLSDTHPAGGSSNEVRLRVVRNQFVPSADQPTFSSGWHTHPGPVFFGVQEGHVRISQGPPCGTKVLGPGDTYIEIPEHPVLATAKRAAKWTTSYVVPADRPLMTPVADPCPARHHAD
jgi:hypothetical protein